MLLLVTMSTWQEFLSNLYFQIKKPGAYAGPGKIKEILKQNGFSVSINNVRNWLKHHDAYTLFKPVKYRFKRNRIVTTGLDYMWDADLADVGNLKEHNDGYSYLLIVIDVFSRYLWVQPVKTKNQKDMKEAFKVIFSNTTRKPARLRTDKGKEFISKHVQEYLKSLKIKSFTTKNETKANYAERVIRTLKTLLYRYFHHKQTYYYLDVLQDLVNNYNSRPHSSLNSLSPKQINKQNEAIVWKKMYINTAKRITKRPFTIKIGDKVRISHLKYTFQRDYQQKWTEEFFIVYQRLRRGSKNLYKIKDTLDEEIDGYFYENELQKIFKEDDPILRIEKVIRRRKNQVLVKWMGWPSKFNSWVAQDSIQRL